MDDTEVIEKGINRKGGVVGRTWSRRERPTPPDGYVPTEDDKQLVLHIWRNRFLDVETACEFFPNRYSGSIQKRLRLAYAAGLIDKVVRGNNLADLYLPDNAGARLLHTEFGIRLPQRGWPTKNKRLALSNVQHDLGATRFLAGVQKGVHARPGHEFEPLENIAASLSDDQYKKALRNILSAHIDWNGHQCLAGTKSDGTFSVYNRTLNVRRYYYLEWDSSSETVTPGIRQCKAASFFRDSSILRKQIIYGFAFRQKLHAKLYGMSAQPRVLVVTTTPARVDTMRAAWHEHVRIAPITAPAGLFLFTDFATLAAHGNDPLSVPWVNAAGREVRLDDYLRLKSGND